MQSVKEIIDEAGGIDALLEIARMEPERRPETLFEMEPLPCPAAGPDDHENQGPTKPRRRKGRAA